MKQLLITLLSASTLLLSCSKKGSNTSPPSGDTTFNGSYIQLNFNNKSYTAKDATFPINGVSNHMVMISGQTDVNGYLILLTDPVGLYGMLSSNIYIQGFSGATTGSYKFSVPTAINQANPYTTYYDSTGTVTITYAGQDYMQGTINSTLYSGGLTYPVTGNFKIYH
jgi:hypothetical protein